MIDGQHIKCLKCGVELTRDSGYTCGCEYPVTISRIELPDDERILREALAAGPTPGPWTPMPADAGEQCVARINNTEAVPPEGVELAHESVDARYIAACSPDRIERLLAEVERLRAELAEAKRPTMFWNLDAADEGYVGSTLQEAVEDACDSMQRGDDPYDIDIGCARTLPSIKVRAWIDETDTLQWDELDAAIDRARGAE